MTSNHKCTISILITSEFEVEFKGDEQHVLAKSINVIPVVIIVDSTVPLSDEDKARIKLMALHTVLSKAYERVASIGKDMKSSVEINMNPPAGEKM